MNGQTTYYLYGASDGGHPIAEYAGGGWYREAIMGGVRWGWLYQNGDGRFTLPDALGSTAVLAQDGTVEASRLYPFGEEAQATSAEYKWTDQIRDANALDHFAFRTYSSNLARWLSPDPAGLAAVNPADPASWNRYAYVENMPLAGIDALGLQGGNCGEPCIVTAPPPDPEAPFINPENPLYQLWWDSQSQLAEALGIGDFSKPPSPAHPSAPTSAGPLPQTPTRQNACTQPILNAVSNQFGRGTYSAANAPPNGGAANLQITATNLTASQFNSLQTGRYPLNWWTYVIGYGPTLHVTGATLFDPNAYFSNSNIGGVTSVDFTAHIDSAFAYNPIGLFIHFLRDLLHLGGPRNPCP